MTRKSILITAIIVLAAVLAGGFQFYRSQQAQAAAQAAARTKEALVRADAMAIGKSDARVQIVEFLDPACGTCAQFYPLVKKMIAPYPADIRLSIRYAPFHPGSEEVVRMLEASRKQGMYWQTLQALLASQPAWVQNHHAIAAMVWPELARIGLDTERIKVDMQSPEIIRLVAKDIADANTVGVSATPEYYVNGRPLPSFGFEQLRNLVQEELAITAAK